MSKWDYVLPHRLLINKSLRKETEKIRKKLDCFQDEIDRKISECEAKIKLYEQEKNQEISLIKTQLENELKNEKEILASLYQDITEYVDKYCQKKYLDKLYRIHKKKKYILQEKKSFYKQQMKILSEEIGLLRKRQDQLANYIDVSDVLELAVESGCDIQFGEESVESMLEKVQDEISKYDDNFCAERNALVRLKYLLQERSEFAPSINYITWVIQQKKQFHKELSFQRRAIAKGIKQQEEELDIIEKELNQTNLELEKISERVRYYWARPITNINIELAYAKKELEDVKSNLSSTYDEIQRMKDRKSNDQDKWERLQKDKKSFKSQKASLGSTIEAEKGKLQEWNSRKKLVFNICYKSGIKLISDKNSEKSDEENIITHRLSEMKAINEEARKEADRIYTRERNAIVEKYNESVKIIDDMLDDLTNELTILESEKKNCELYEVESKSYLSLCQKQDTRFYILKLFADDPKVLDAKKDYNNAKRKTNSIESKIEDCVSKINKLQSEREKLQEQHQKKLKQCKTKPQHPTSEELREEKKLEYRKKEIEKYRSWRK